MGMRCCRFGGLVCIGLEFCEILMSVLSLTSFRRQGLCVRGTIRVRLLDGGTKSGTLVSRTRMDDNHSRRFDSTGLAIGHVGLGFATWHPSWVAAWSNAEGDDSTNGGDDNPTASSASLMVAFFVSLLVGTAVGHLLLSVVASAVDTVLVAWAEAPLELERHYPGLYAAQVAAWRQAYPQEFGM